MHDDGRLLLTIGHVSRRTGLPVRTIRFWSDTGAVPPAGRTSRGYRLYDAEAVARLELVHTLRELGVGLEDIRRVLDRETTVAQVAAAHVEALDAQIRTLRLRRAVLGTVARRASSTEEMALMNRLARLSAEERQRIVDDFVDEAFAGLGGGGHQATLRRASPNLPADPTPEQVDAWVELAEMVQDPDFRRGVRALATYAVAPRGGAGTARDPLGRRVLEHAVPAHRRGIAPGSPEAAAVLDRMLAGTPEASRRAQLLARLEPVADPRLERYWRLVEVINGWPPAPDGVPDPEHLVAGLRAHRWAVAALRAHP